jgi:DNA-binding XRE family transcriptional regulator
MKTAKRKKLEAAGWKVGSAADLLGLTPEEKAVVEIRLALADKLKQHRAKFRMSQQAVAERIGSSQSRVAKIEAADKSVSLDLMISTLVRLGRSRREIGRAIASRVPNVRR